MAAVVTGNGLRFADSSLHAAAFTEIPVLDLGPARSPNIEDRKALARRLRDVAMNVGFLQISNTGVPECVVQAAFDQAHRFFDMPEDFKMLLDINKSANFKGYTPLLGENTNPENRGDLHEAFDFGAEAVAGAGGGPGLAAGNNWPPRDALPGFREAVNEYFSEMMKLGKVLFRLFALALDLNEDFFDDKTTKVGSIARLLHYPPQTGVIDDRVIGIGAHTDYECFTILRQDEVPALQVLNQDGKWVDAPPTPGCFVLNIGDSLARWSNDLFLSTVHRAINRSGARRFSIPCFVGVDYDVMLDVLPTCVSKDRPAKYSPILAGDYVKARLEATYGPPDRHKDDSKASL
ncbi:2OG-Fe-II oxygenase [Hyaloraphidium curvatum]|nr:2OG-Fe-II oxygenase [Hyaloraphidium curvatum]